MKKIILTTLLACTTSAVAHHETISSEFSKKFVETKPTVNLNHYSDSMVASGWGSVRFTLWVDCFDDSRTCLTHGNQLPQLRCGNYMWCLPRN